MGTVTGRQGSLDSEQTSKNSTQSFLKKKKHISHLSLSFFFSFHCFSYISPSCVCKSHLNRAGHFYVAQLEVIHCCFGVWVTDSHESSIQLFHGRYCCASCSNKVCQNVQHKSLSSSPFGVFMLCPSSTASFSFLPDQWQGSVDSVDGVPQRKSSSLVIVFFF